MKTAGKSLRNQNILEKKTKQFKEIKEIVVTWDLRKQKTENGKRKSNNVTETDTIYTYTL